MSSTTTMGVRLDEATRERIKNAAQRLDRTSHWLIKQAIYNYLEQLDNKPSRARTGYRCKRKSNF